MVYPGSSTLTTYLFRYNNLGDFYRNPFENGFVTAYLPLGYSNWIPVNPPEPLYVWFPINIVTDLKNRIIWEEVGRMCHLLEDMSVPAHTHFDPHPTDTYEKNYMAPSNHGGSDHYMDYNWTQARDAGGLLNLSDKQYKLRYLMYTLCAITRRFPSDDYWGINQYDNSYQNDNYSNTLQPIFNSINNLNPAVPVEPGVSSLTSGRISMYSYVYCMRAVASFLWYVYNEFGITSGMPPTINSITCNKSDSKAFWNETLRLTPSVSGTGPITLAWHYHKCDSYNSGCQNTSPIPTGLVITMGSFFDLNNSVGINCQSNSSQCYHTAPCTVNGYYPNCGTGNFFVSVDLVASNPYGSTTLNYSQPIIPYSAVRPPPPPPHGGCPYVYIWNADSTTFNLENNLLHRSEFSEYTGTDISDLYKLNTPPALIGDKYALQIGESENDHDYFDKVRLIAVDHPVGTVIVVTESNQIAMFDTTNVQSTDLATQNANVITPYIQYFYNGLKKVSGTKGDSIYAHYDTTAQNRAFQRFLKNKNGLKNTFIPDSVALVGEIQSDEEWHGGGGYKNYEGVINIFTNNAASVRPFAARQVMSKVVIPFGGLNDAVDHIDVIWNGDYSLTYFTVVPISYSGFTLNTLALSSAISSIDNQDVTSLLSEQDQQYLEIDSSGYVTLFFNIITPPKSGQVRDFVFETNGRYDVLSSGSGVMHKQTQSSNTTGNHTFNLYSNYPNPFNPKTQIRYNIPYNTFVKLTVYDILGQLVATLVNENKSTGNYLVEFDGSNLASGLYIYKIEAGTYTNTKKMLLIK